MAKVQSIKPFPSDIDRDYFAAYLSGFSDGEGCFRLYFTSHGTPGATFIIALRQDDNNILKLIQSFWECGRLYFNSRFTVGKEVFGVQYSVNVVPDLARVVVPHFAKFPMFAKKSRDYQIWKEGVALIVTRERRGKDAHGQYGKRWTTAELSDFTSLHDTLKAQRGLNTATLPIPTQTTPDNDCPLFDSQ